MDGAGGGQALLAVLVGSLDEGRRTADAAPAASIELGVELASEEVGMVGDFDDLDVGSVGSGAGDLKAGAGEQLLVFAIELVAVTMAFADLGGAVGRWANDPGSNLQVHAPRRMVPPSSSTPRSSRSL